MRTIELPGMGFWVRWNFFKEKDDDEIKLTSYAIKDQVLSDINIILKVCAKHELLYPKYYLDENSIKKEFENESTDSIISYLRQKISAGTIDTEIRRMGGDGVIIMPNGEKVIQRDLICIDSIRLFERNTTISTNKSIWVPISIDTEYSFEWQIELAEQNAMRLENCLQEIYNLTQLSVSPAINEIDKDQPVWQKGFKLFINPSILIREYEMNPPQNKIELNKYLLDDETSEHIDFIEE